jgi:hypothetical protein
MPMPSPVTQFSTNKLLPLYALQRFVLELPINLAPSTTFARGLVLGQITGSAADVQTLTLTGVPTGGTITLTGTNPLTGQPFTTAAIAFNANAATTAAAVQAALGNVGITVTGGGGPLPGATTLTFGGTAANVPVPALALGTNALTGGTTPTATIAHTTIGRSAGTYAAYASGNGDGTQVAKCILPYACATDASGNITMGATASGGFWQQTSPSIDAYFKGHFDTTQLVGLDAAGAANLGRLVSGTAAAGVLEVT